MWIRSSRCLEFTILHYYYYYSIEFSYKNIERIEQFEEGIESKKFSKRVTCVSETWEDYCDVNLPTRTDFHIVALLIRFIVLFTYESAMREGGYATANE